MTCTCPSPLGDQCHMGDSCKVVAWIHSPRHQPTKPHLYKVGPSWYCKQKNQPWTRLGPRADTPAQAYAKFRSLYHA